MKKPIFVFGISIFLFNFFLLGRVLAAVPDGHYFYHLKADYLNTGDDGNATDTLSVVAHGNAGSFAAPVTPWGNNTYLFPGISPQNLISNGNPITNSSAVTASFNFWVNPSGLSNDELLFAIAPSNPDSPANCSLKLLASGAIRYRNNDPSSPNNLDSADGVIPPNSWSMVTVKLNDNGTLLPNIDTIEIFVNGSLVSRSATMDHTSCDGNKFLWLGDDGGGNHLNGSLSEFGVWANYILTSQDIAQLYNAGNGCEIQNCGAAKEPVIIVPGIMGSYLNRASNGEEVWPDTTTMLLPGGDAYLDDLQLDGNGTQIIGKEMNAPSVIEEELGRVAYGNLLNNFFNKGYQLGVNLFIFPYDWRLDIRDEAERFAQKVNDILALPSTSKVNIIAHSLGGLLVKEYLSSVADPSIVDKLVFLGVPNLGAPKALKIMNYGDDLDFKFPLFGLFDVSILNIGEVKKISQNMPSVYQLLPSREYIARNTNLDNGSYVIDHRDSRHAMTYDETKSFLESEGRNNSLLDRADAFHQIRDGLNINIATSTKFYNISGCQNNQTIGGFNIYEKTFGRKEYGLRLTNGDGTVPLVSANSFANATKNYFVSFSQTGADHLGLVKSTTTLGLIDNLLNDNPDSQISGISQGSTMCQSGGETLLISAHSPVELHVYDSQNRHVGPDANGNIEFAIPGSGYQTIEEDKFAFVPAGDTYRVVLKATDIGSADLHIELLNGTDSAGKITYLNIPLQTASATAEVSITNISNSPVLSIDNDGNGTADANIQPTAVLSPSESIDTNPPVIAMPNIPTDILLNATATLNFSATDDISGVEILAATLDGNSVEKNAIITLSTVGEHVLTVRAIDRAGNPAVKELRFRVIYQFSGFLSPVKPDGSGIYKQGRTLPVKFRLVDSSGQFISASIAHLFLAKISDGIAGTEEVALSTSAADSGNLFRYDQSANQYIFNLSTSIGLGTWQLRVELNDGKSYTVNISINN